MEYIEDNRSIYCCGCKKEVDARLTNGAEIYPHRKDLSTLPFWWCDTCNNYVGCHHKTKNKTEPLGNIPTPEIREARKRIHKILDPLWEGKKIKRSTLYGRISDEIGWQYHTAQIRSVDEAQKIYKVIMDISDTIK